MARINSRLKQKINFLALIPLAFLSFGFFFFAYKFQLLPKTSNDPQVISDGNAIVWGEPEVWQYNAEDTKDWRTYTSPNLEISFKYPPKDWYPKDEKQNWGYNVLITAPTDEYTAQNYHEGQELIIKIVKADQELAKDVEENGWENFVAKTFEDTYYLDRKKARVSEFKSTALEGILITQRKEMFSNMYVLRDGKLFYVHMGVFNALPITVFDKYLVTAKMLANTLE